jgi:hypothetical protein
MKNFRFFFSLILAGLVFILLVKCKGDEASVSEENTTYHIEGIVIDQVTRLPVTGALVYSAGLPFNSFGEKLRTTGSVTSDQDGRFEITMPVSAFDPDEIRNSLLYPKIFGSGNGYVGSNYFTPSTTGSNTIELYHPAKLSLSVKNDTINNEVDEIYLALVGSTQFMSYPDFIGRTSDFADPYVIRNCKGRTFEMVFEFSPLWGNLNYQIMIRKPNTPWSIKTSVLLKPDTIVTLSISF